jgi:transcription initiation factor IIE alpha subunit
VDQWSVIAEKGRVKEQQLAEILHIPTPDVRKYLGMLHVHRLVKR